MLLLSIVSQVTASPGDAVALEPSDSGPRCGSGRGAPQCATGPGLRVAGSNLIGNSFGMFMCLPKENYVPIPEDLTVWGGDD